MRHAKKATNTSKTTLTSAFKKLEEVAAYCLNRLLYDVGKFDLIVISIALVAAIYRIFLPDINEDLIPLFRVLFPNFFLPPSSIISTISLGAITLFFILLLLRLIMGLVVKLVQFLGIMMGRFYNLLIKFVLKILYLINLKTQAEQLNKLLLSFKSEVYLKEMWLTESQLEGKRWNVPIDPSKFQYAKCKVKALNITENHWRAGIIFEGSNRQEYIFHVHEDFSEPGLLKTRIVLRVPNREVRDKRSKVSWVSDIRNLQLEVRKVDENLLFLVNDREIDLFDVPLGDISKLYFAAWADNRQFKIEFTDMEVVA